MRNKVRGFQKIEQAELKRQGTAAADHVAGDDPRSAPAGDLSPAPARVVDAADSVVLDYCAAVRGILNDDQGGSSSCPACGWTRR